MKNDNNIINTHNITIRQPLWISWKPNEDITTYELAQCLPLLMSVGGIYDDMIDGYPDAPYLRHFQITDPNKKL
jgi:hypothetical protein